MGVYYFDSSALVKRYVLEPGSDWVDAVLTIDRGEPFKHAVTCAEIGFVEVAAAFARLTRSGAMTEIQCRELMARFMADAWQWIVPIEVTKAVVREAISLTERQPLRGYDAVHLAAAHAMRRALPDYMALTPIFVSADLRLCEAARAEGFEVIDPSTPPH